MERKPGLSKAIGDKDVSQIPTYPTVQALIRLFQYMPSKQFINLYCLFDIIVHSKKGASEQKVRRCRIKNWRFNG